jgi:methyltransferase
MPAWWVVLFLGVQRLFELALSRRNLERLRRKGGREFFPESFPAVAALHALFLAVLLAGSWGKVIPLEGRTWLCLGVLVPLQFLRYWCMATLGENWNARIVVVPGGSAVRRGPYRLLRHPNYLAVSLEFLFLPLLLRAPFALVFFPLNLLVLSRRIRLEERALRDATDYGRVFG